MADAKAKYILTAEDRTKVALRSARKGLDRFKSSAASLTRVLAGIGAAVSFGAVIKATVRQENALRQLEQRLKSTKGVVGITAQEIEGFAGSLQKLTTFGDEAIIEMQNLLLTFTNIRGGVFEDTTMAVLDMSVAMDQDLKTSALALGKALNDPIKGITALTRVGVTFSDSQKDTIKQMVKAGRVADAQRLILAELETEFGGAAVAAADTFGGSLDQLGNAFGDLLEQKGGLNDAKAAIQDLTRTLQDPAVAQGLNNLIAGAATLASYAAKAATEFANLGQQIAVNAADITGNLGELDRLEQEIKDIDRALSGSWLTTPIKYIGTSDEELNEIRKRLVAEKEALLAVYGARPKSGKDKPDIPDNPTGAGYNLSGGGDSKDKPDKVKAQYDAALSALQRAKAAIGQTTEYEKVLWEIQNGRYKDLNANQQQALLDAARAVDAKRQEAKAAQDLADTREKEKQALIEYNQAQEDAAQQWRELLNPMEEVDNQLRELDTLLAEGRISWDVYGNAIFHVMEGMDDASKKTKKTKDEFEEFGKQAARNIQGQFADFLFDPFDEGLDGMLAGFINTIHRMVSELLAQQVLRSFFTSLSGGDSGSFFGTLAAGVKHGGGIAGGSGVSRTVPTLAFAGAPRLHSGGIAGLKSNEVPTILEKGEGVFTKEQMAAMGGGESQSQQPLNIAIVDERKSYEEFAASNAGGKIMMVHIQKNAQAVKRLLA